MTVVWFSLTVSVIRGGWSGSWVLAWKGLSAPGEHQSVFAPCGPKASLQVLTGSFKATCMLGKKRGFQRACLSGLRGCRGWPGHFGRCPGGSRW